MFETTAFETNGISVVGDFHGVDRQPARLSELKGGRITRVRLLTEVWPGRGRLADISYIYGEKADGTPVTVIDYPTTYLLREVKGDFIRWAAESGVYAKGLGLLDETNWSILY